MNDDPRADMRDAIRPYLGERIFGLPPTPEVVIDALMPIVDRYADAKVAAELDRVADDLWEVGTTEAVFDFVAALRVRAAQLLGGQS